MNLLLNIVNLPYTHVEHFSDHFLISSVLQLLQVSLLDLFLVWSQGYFIKIIVLVSTWCIPKEDGFCVWVLGSSPHHVPWELFHFESWLLSLISSHVIRDFEFTSLLPLTVFFLFLGTTATAAFYSFGDCICIYGKLIWDDVCCKNSYLNKNWV